MNDLIKTAIEDAVNETEDAATELDEAVADAVKAIYAEVGRRGSKAHLQLLRRKMLAAFAEELDSMIEDAVEEQEEVSRG